jgi:protein-S-isoprenylcysteine O-methyltransferase Ste14
MYFFFSQLLLLCFRILIITHLFGIALFLPAGTWDYPQAWFYFTGFALWTIFGSIWFAISYPSPIARRLDLGPQAESRPAQKIIHFLILAAVLAIMAFPGLDRRYKWGPIVPKSICVIAGFVVLIGMAIGCRSAIYNEYMATTITVERAQKVISTGPYAIVRHPMYTGCLLWGWFTPLALGSWVGEGVALCMVFILVWRLLDEESHLKAQLNGYKEYCGFVQWRLIPYMF